MPVILKGQDSLKTQVISKNFFLFESLSAVKRAPIDTAFNQLSNYFPRNLMGNTALPGYEYLLRFGADDLGVRWFNPPYPLSGTDFYQRKGINTNIFGAAGSKQEQILKLTHYQNITENLNVSLKLNRFNSLGFYHKQQSFVNNLFFTSNYVSKNKRVGYFISYGFDRFKNQENGGITSDTSIVNEPTIDKAIIPVYLENATRNYTVMSASANLFIRLNKDSAASVNHFLLPGCSWSMNKSIYSDVPSPYYDTTYIDPTSTHDTTKFFKLSPKLSYNLVSKKMSVEAGAQFDRMRWLLPDDTKAYPYYKADKITIDSSRWITPDTLIRYESMLLFQRFAFGSPESPFDFREQAQYIFSGKNAGDYSLGLDAGYHIPFGKTSVRLKAQHEFRSPDLFYNFNRVNNYYWRNNFDKTTTTGAQLFAMSEQLQLTFGVTYRMISNYIYLDQASYPVQLNSRISAVRLYLKHHLKLKKIHLENELNYQSSSSYALPLPSVYTQHQLYIEHRVKKNGLKFQIGVQANYVGAMDRISYNPALNSFYMKYTKEQGGNYVFLDAFFSMYFKPVKLFVKSEHLNQGFTGLNYSLLNGYYQPDRAFRFGLNWEFWD